MPSKLMALALLLLTALGCESKSTTTREALKLDGSSSAPDLPPGFKLDLPTAPIVVSKPDSPIQYPDGSYSVHGLLAKKDDLLNKEVKVLAHVVELHAPKKPTCPPCTPPHLYLADSARPPEAAPRFLVADFQPQDVKSLRTGERYIFAGRFLTTSLSRFVRAEGLLSFRRVTKP